MADIKFLVSVDSKTAEASIKRLDAQVDKLPATTKKAAGPPGGFQEMWKKIGAGIAVLSGVMISMRGLIKFMGDATEKAKAQELAEKGMTDALASTGRKVPINAEHFKRYASELQKATKYGDEQILGTQALLIQLTNLDRKGLDAATKGSIGLATVFKTDLKAATNLVAKALAGNYGALSRYGISVTNLNTDEEKRASLLQQLGVLYERATGEVDTFDGTVTQLSNTFGDAKEKIGDTIVKSKEFRKWIVLIQETLSNFVASGAMDNWARTFDAILKNTPMVRELYYSLSMMNAKLALQVAEQKRATEIGEDWYNFLKDSDAELKIFGIDIYKAMRNLIGFDNEGKHSHTIISNLSVDFIEARLAQEKWNKLFPKTTRGIQDMVNETEDGIIALAMLRMEGETSGSVLEDVMRRLGLITEETIAKMKTTWEEYFDSITGSFQEMIGMMGGITGQWYQNQMIQIDNLEQRQTESLDFWYQQQKDRIEQTITDEEEKKEALEDLEEEYNARMDELQTSMEEKAKAAKREAAEHDKAVALMAAIVNVAQAVTKTYASVPFPFNIPLAAAIAALGAIQIAAIKAQPIPLAKGAIFERPTYLVGEAGSEALIGVTPLVTEIRRTIHEEVHRSYRSPSRSPVVNVYIGNERFKNFTVKTVEREADLGNLHLPQKAIRQK